MDDNAIDYSEPRRPRGQLVALPAAAGAALPHSLEAEAALLSCILLDGLITLRRCQNARLDSRAFYDGRHAVVWKKICALAAQSKPVEIATLAEELRADGELDSLGGVTWLMALSETVPTTVQAAYWLDVVVDLALRRSAIREFQGCLERARDRKLELNGMLSACALKMQRLADFAVGRNRVSLRERLEKRLSHTMAELDGRVDKSRWLTTGLEWLDGCILPFDCNQEDWYIIIAAPPSGCKSSFMRHVAVHSADHGKRGAVFILETGLRWIDQAAATAARVNLREKDAWLKERRRDYEARYRQLMDYAEERLWIFEDLVHVEDIERQIRELHRTLREKEIATGVPEEQARGLDYVVIDYLQICQTHQNFRGFREQTVAFISARLKQLFRDLHITGFVGAQINREARADASVPPKLSALRESGSIEQDADRVIFLHTPATNRAGAEQNGQNLIDEIDIIQRKSRNGPRDVSVTVLFAKTYTKFMEAPRAGEVRPGLPKPSGGYKRAEGPA